MRFDFSAFDSQERDDRGRFAPLSWHEQRTGRRAFAEHGEYAVSRVGAKHQTSYKPTGGLHEHVGTFDTPEGATEAAERHHASKQK